MQVSTSILKMQYYHITEGSNLSQPIRMMFTNNQNPFNLTVSGVAIDREHPLLLVDDINRAIKGKS